MVYTCSWPPGPPSRRRLRPRRCVLCLSGTAGRTRRGPRPSCPRPTSFGSLSSRQPGDYPPRFDPIYNYAGLAYRRCAGPAGRSSRRRAAFFFFFFHTVPTCNLSLPTLAHLAGGGRAAPPPADTVGTTGSLGVAPDEVGDVPAAMPALTSSLIKTSWSKRGSSPRRTACLGVAHLIWRPRETALRCYRCTSLRTTSVLHVAAHAHAHSYTPRSVNLG